MLFILGRALKKHPRANASLDDGALEIVYKDYCHIGVAVDTEGGLIVPVLRDVDKKNLLQLSSDLHALTEKTRQRKISIEELQGGTLYHFQSRQHRRQPFHADHLRAPGSDSRCRPRPSQTGGHRRQDRHPHDPAALLGL